MSSSARRSLEYSSFDEFLADAQRCMSDDFVTVGNWSKGKIFTHLARTLEMSLDGVDYRAPWWMRVLGKWVLKPRILKKGMPSGFQLKKPVADQVIPQEDVDSQQALQDLQRAVERYRSEPDRVDHPIFGAMTAEEWDKLHLRHADLHMSHIAPAEAD